MSTYQSLVHDGPASYVTSADLPITVGPPHYLAHTATGKLAGQLRAIWRVEVDRRCRAGLGPKASQLLAAHAKRDVNDTCRDLRDDEDYERRGQVADAWLSWFPQYVTAEAGRVVQEAALHELGTSNSSINRSDEEAGARRAALATRLWVLVDTAGGVVPYQPGSLARQLTRGHAKLGQTLPLVHAVIDEALRDGYAKIVWARRNQHSVSPLLVLCGVPKSPGVNRSDCPGVLLPPAPIVATPVLGAATIH